MVSPRQKLLAYALLTPLVLGDALLLLDPRVRRAPPGFWVIFYGGSVLAALAGGFVASKWSMWRYRQVPRPGPSERPARRRSTRDETARARTRGSDVEADILDGNACVLEERFADAVGLYSGAVSRIEELRLRRLVPAVPMLKNNIAWCLVELGEDPHRAVDLATASAAWAMRQRKERPKAFCLGTLGAAQFRNGEHPAAIQTLREALA